MNKNQAFTFIIIVVFLALSWIWIVEQNSKNEKEDMKRLMKDQETEMTILATKIQLVRTEIALNELNAFMAQAHGINYLNRGLMNQTPTTF